MYEARSVVIKVSMFCTHQQFSYLEKLSRRSNKKVKKKMISIIPSMVFNSKFCSKMVKKDTIIVIKARCATITIMNPYKAVKK